MSLDSRIRGLPLKNKMSDWDNAHSERSISLLDALLCSREDRRAVVAQWRSKGQSSTAPFSRSILSRGGIRRAYVALSKGGTVRRKGLGRGEGSLFGLSDW
jgi:hypothetical protein